MDIHMRRSIDPETRLYVTLHYLSSRSSCQAIAMRYALGRSTGSGIIFDTCKAMVDLLVSIYLKPAMTYLPQTSNDVSQMGRNCKKVMCDPDCSCIVFVQLFYVSSISIQSSLYLQ